MKLKKLWQVSTKAEAASLLKFAFQLGSRCDCYQNSKVSCPLQSRCCGFARGNCYHFGFSVPAFDLALQQETTARNITAINRMANPLTLQC